MYYTLLLYRLQHTFLDRITKKRRCLKKNMSVTIHVNTHLLNNNSVVRTRKV